jgi:MFS-type transporter involved in bile tolerance (Atg22 family)
VFGLVSHATHGNQRASILAIGTFFVLGLALLSRVRAGGPTAPRVVAADTPA